VYAACLFGETAALEGVGVNFTVVSGPNVGKTADVPLGADGSASFAYTSAATGTDTVLASLTLPDVCYVDYSQETGDETIPAGCEGATASSDQPSTEATCSDSPQTEVVAVDCPTVALTASSELAWTSPVVAQAADPSLAISRFKRCVSRKFKIAPAYSGGPLKSSTLFIDGKKTQTRTASNEPFTVNARRYKSGKHNFEVVSVFASGKAASKFGSFTRCRVRVTQARVSPKFTG
jgi:hypothetical protein